MKKNLDFFEDSLLQLHSHDHHTGRLQMCRLDLQTGKHSILQLSFLDELDVIAPSIKLYVRKHKQIPTHFLHTNTSGALTLHIDRKKEQKMSEFASFCTSIKQVVRRETTFFTYKFAIFLDSRFRFNATRGTRSASGESRSCCRKTLSMRHSSRTSQRLRERCLHVHRLIWAANFNHPCLISLYIL